ncbi:O-methyltransferase [Rhizobacter sp. OV335]|uniref:O-methyltransferase n=1 Tax=Rhizobacter sp. OV335 TaxID=1500264 RepID=UPI00091B0AFC|nr:O-methyltransferase [Rhizobacter sp. OV335]SHN34520.1 Predicted O-methyltransferase YrrM [Rhizobacter sp. OV335]
MSNETAWREVDDYFCSTLLPADPVLEQALRDSDAAGLPPHAVAPNQGRLLNLLVRLQGARRVLEIGTLGGYSTIWLARALPPGGRVITLEANPVCAEVARINIERAELADRIEIRVGRAADSLPQLLAEGAGPFDFIFIDADKPSNPLYLEWALKLSRPGTAIVGDNVVRHGAVADPHSTDANVQGVRRFLELMAAEPRLSATAVQTVGSKGWDGFSLAIVET